MAKNAIKKYHKLFSPRYFREKVEELCNIILSNTVQNKLKSNQDAQ